MLSSQAGSCVFTDCQINLDSCPTNENNDLGDLRVIKDWQVVACLSPCKKWNYPPPYGFGRNEHEWSGEYMCCPTPPITPQQCKSGPVVQTNYVQNVRSNCPSAYSYAYDDANGLVRINVIYQCLYMTGHVSSSTFHFALDIRSCSCDSFLNSNYIFDILTNSNHSNHTDRSQISDFN